MQHIPANKRQVITISGLPGSGKSSTAKGVAAALGFQHFSSGDFMRQIGQQRGLSIDETNRAAETDPSFDVEVDDAIRTTGEGEKLVIDSRIAFHWIPASFKVFLKIDAHTAAERTFAQMQTSGRIAETGTSVEEVYTKLVARTESERKRYAATYNGLDYMNEIHYNLVIDTARFPLTEVISMIVHAYETWLGGTFSR